MDILNYIKNRNLRISGSMKFSIRMDSNLQQKGVTCRNHHLKNSDSKKIFFNTYRDRFELVHRALGFSSFPEHTDHRAMSCPPATAVTTNIAQSIAHEHKLFSKRQHRAAWLCGDSREAKPGVNFISTTFWARRNLRLKQFLKFALVP